MVYCFISKMIRQKVNIFLRVRSLLESESSETITKVINQRTIKVQRGLGKFNMHFDHVLSQQCGQENVFYSIQPYIDSFLNGTNSTIIAYGQTQAGKTYTSIGTDTNPGILPSSISYVFSALEGKKYKAWCCCYEVYNERIFDLFDLKTSKEV
jgi:hypothetical protein